MLHKIFNNNLVAVHKSKVTLALNKPTYTGVCILELSKVLIYKLYYDYIKNKYDNDSSLLFIDNESLMYEIKTGNVYEDFINDKEMFDFNNYLTKSKRHHNSNKLVIGKMKNETACATIEELVGLKSKMYSFLVDNNSQHEKAYGVNKKDVATKVHNEYGDVSWNNNMRHSMNRIHRNDYRIEAFEINKISLPVFDNKRYIQNNVCDELALDSYN